MNDIINDIITFYIDDNIVYISLFHYNKILLLFECFFFSYFYKKCLMNSQFVKLIMVIKRLVILIMIFCLKTFIPIGVSPITCPCTIFGGIQRWID